MINISWLESLATMTDHDLKIDEVLKSQLTVIQKAYRDNDHLAINALLGGSERLPYKQVIFQL